jgi:ParB family chromosome partitioning protein
MKRPRGLGKGLDALIPPAEAPEESSIFSCPVDAISPHPDQPRKRFDNKKLHELVHTIQTNGVLSPVLVRPLSHGYQLISGERRWRAAKMAGMEHIPAIVREISDREALELSLIENLQREDLTPLEEATAYHTLLELHHLTHEELARRLGRDRSTITNALRLMKLDKAVQQALENGHISAGHARALLPLPSEAQRALLKEIIEKDLSVRTTEQRTKTYGKRPPTKTLPAPPSSPHLEEIRTRLRATLSTQVKIFDGKKKGKIVIEYYNKDDLHRIVERLLASQP